MQEVISGVEDLAALFNVFHDGVIVAASEVGQDLLLQVEIRYLAERVAPEFTTFSLRLQHVEDLSFSTWPNDSAATPEVLRVPAAIFYPELDILSGEPSGELVQVVCNQSSTETAHCGGTLTFRAASALVCDQSSKPYSLAELMRLAEAYWKEWGERYSRPG